MQQQVLEWAQVLARERAQVPGLAQARGPERALAQVLERAQVLESHWTGGPRCHRWVGVGYRSRRRSLPGPACKGWQG